MLDYIESASGSTKNKSDSTKDGESMDDRQMHTQVAQIYLILVMLD